MLQNYGDTADVYWGIGEKLRQHCATHRERRCMCAIEPDEPAKAKVKPQLDTRYNPARILQTLIAG